MHVCVDAFAELSVSCHISRHVSPAEMYLYLEVNHDTIGANTQLRIVSSSHHLSYDIMLIYFSLFFVCL